MKRLAILEPGTGVGGAEVNVMRLAPVLRGHGWDVLFLVPGEGALTQALARQGLGWCVYPAARVRTTSRYVKRRRVTDPAAMVTGLESIRRMARGLAELLRREHVTLVHTNALTSHLAGGMACAQAKIPCVWHLQDIVDPRAGLRLFRPLLDFGARMWATRVVCISRAVAAQLGRAAQSRVSIIYNGVDPDLFTPDGPAPYRERWLGKHFEMVVGQVGRFTPWKGQEDVLALARRAREAGLPIRFVLVGDDSFGYPGFGQVLAHRIAREHLEAQVLMAGWLEDLPNVYRSLDLLVHPLHLPEPFGLVLAEAMGCARPVALFPRGGAGEVVDSTEVGLRLPPGNLDALWRAIVWVYENRAAAQAMGARGRRHVIEHFSFEQFANQFLELYDALAPTPAAAASRAPQT